MDVAGVVGGIVGLRRERRAAAVGQRVSGFSRGVVLRAIRSGDCRVRERAAKADRRKRNSEVFASRRNERRRRKSARRFAVASQ